MPVPLLDLQAQWQQIEEEVRAAIDEVFATHRYIGGPILAALEQEIADYCGAQHGIGCASGSDALVLALMALEVGPGDEVIVPTFTFFATAGAVSRVGATPVFADIDPASYNLPAAEVERLVSERTRAVIPVHLFGQLADMDPIVAACQRHNLTVIEDAAQSIGAKYKGRRCGRTGGDVVIFSFFPSKNLGCLGDGGLCVTDEAALADRMRILRNHGAEPKYYHKYVGMNSRLDALQAAALQVKLKHLEDWHEGRRANAADYDAKLADAAGIETPWISPDCWSIYNQYTIRVKQGKRDTVVAGLRERGIGCEVYYPVPLHLQQCYADLGGKPGDCPIAEQACAEVLSIPIYPELTVKQRDEVVTTIRELVGCPEAAAERAGGD